MRSFYQARGPFTAWFDDRQEAPRGWRGGGKGLATAQRKRILACRDLARLDRWLLKALTATSTAQLLPARKAAPRATKTPAARTRGR